MSKADDNETEDYPPTHPDYSKMPKVVYGELVEDISQFIDQYYD